MTFLRQSQTPVNLCDSGVFFIFGNGPIERCAVELIIQIRKIPFDLY